MKLPTRIVPCRTRIRMMSTVQSLSFAFIPADEFGRPEAGARKLIRSHCMTGKNTKPQSRKRGTPRASTKQATAAPKDSSKNETTTELVPKGGKSTRSLPLLSPPPTDLALVRFAGEEIDRSSLELVFKCPRHPSGLQNSRID